MNKVQVYKLHPNAILPTRTNPTDAGLDLYALEDTFIHAGSTKVIKTGIAINIPEGYVGLIRDRSSMAIKKFIVGAGVLDAGYSGDVSVVLHNSQISIPDLYPQQIEQGDRIAQLLIQKIETPEVEEVKELWTSVRGDTKFGSSGR